MSWSTGLVEAIATAGRAPVLLIACDYDGTLAPIVYDPARAHPLRPAIAGLRGRMSDAGRVLTPHDGEYTQLTGHPPGADRIDAARRLAAERGSVVLLKGPTTTVASPTGAVRIVVAGDTRLATAGTGDVLSGVIGALLASGLDAFDAAAVGAQAHALAARRCPTVGTTASMLPPMVSAVLSDALSAKAARPRRVEWQ